MKVLVTGATGFVGRNVVKFLKEKKYDVVGLCRNEEASKKLKDNGVTPLIGDIEEPQKIADASKEVDAVIHLAFIHDFTKYAASIATDIKFIETILNALKGTNKPFIATSGTAVVGDTSVIGPVDDYEPFKITEGRGACEEAVLKGKDLGVRTSLIRLPSFVYGQNGPGFVADMIKISRERGESNFIEGSTNRLNFVHVDDAARLYVDALENGKSGSIYHGATESIEFRKIAEAVAQMLGVPLKGITKEEANSIWGFLVLFFALDIRVTAHRSEEELGWKPTHPVGIIDDIVKGSYKQGSMKSSNGLMKEHLKLLKVEHALL